MLEARCWMMAVRPRTRTRPRARPRARARILAGGDTRATVEVL
jgi:hypothetical protein